MNTAWMDGMPGVITLSVSTEALIHLTNIIMSLIKYWIPITITMAVYVRVLLMGILRIMPGQQIYRSLP